MNKFDIDDSTFLVYFKDSLPKTIDEFVEISVKNNLGGPKSPVWWNPNKLLVWEVIYERIKNKIENNK